MCWMTHSAPSGAEVCTFLFWMVHCGMPGRCAVGWVSLVKENIKLHVTEHWEGNSPMTNKPTSPITLHTSQASHNAPPHNRNVHTSAPDGALRVIQQAHCETRETFSALLALCAGNSPVTGEFPWQWSVKWSWCFLWSAHWINDWVDNREAGDLRRHQAHYDIIVMWHSGGLLLLFILYVYPGRH